MTDSSSYFVGLGTRRSDPVVLDGHPLDQSHSESILQVLHLLASRMLHPLPHRLVTASTASRPLHHRRSCHLLCRSHLEAPKHLLLRFHFEEDDWRSHCDNRDPLRRRIEGEG